MNVKDGVCSGSLLMMAGEVVRKAMLDLEIAEHVRAREWVAVGYCGLR